MNMKNIRKRKGSSLVLILIVMSILMILGTSMLTLAVSSYKFRSLEQNRKTNLYASEAGLDVAYEKIGKFVDEGIKQGNKAVEEYDKNFENLIKVERYRIEHGKDGKSAYIDENGLITENTVDEDRKRVFKYGYMASNKVSFEIGYMEDGKRKDIECYDNSESGREIEIGYTQFIQKNIDNDCISKINATTDSKLLIQAKVSDSNYTSYPIKVSINSKYTQNSIPREIEAVYEIRMAEHNVQYSLPTKIVKIPKNPIWSKALMVNGDMKINDGKVNIINGDIYVKGKDGKIQTSGIDLTNKDSKLYSNGNIVTNQNLLFSYTYNGNEINKGKPNNIDIKGNIYAKNVFVNGTAKGARLNTNGSIYTLDDLEINAPNSYVNIDDSYYGVSDGSEGERNNPDNSSSIIVNTEDIGNRTGDQGKFITHNPEVDSTLTIGKNVYIAGTSYINLLNNIKYQTGESISIVGNYRAYTEALPFTDEYLTKDINNKDNIRYKEDNVIFDYFDPLTLVKKYKEGNLVSTNPVEAVIEKDRYITVYLTEIGTSSIPYNTASNYTIEYKNEKNESITTKMIPVGRTVKIGVKKSIGDEVKVTLYQSENKLGDIQIKLISHTELNAFDKSKYFEEYQKQFPNENGLNLGEGIAIDKGIGENIHAGSIFTSQNSDSSVSSGNWSIELDRKIKARSIQLKNQLFYMGLAKDYVDLTNTPDIDTIEDSSNIGNSRYDEIDDKTEPVIKINDNVHFDSLNSKCEEKNGEVIILDTSINSTHVLGSEASNLPGNFPKSNLKGIIITNGNVIISGELNFTGTIICGGDLIFQGTGDKNITYDKAYLENFAINNYQLFKSAFEDVGKYAQNDESNYLFAKVYNNINSSGSTEANNQLVRRTKWKLVK